MDVINRLFIILFLAFSLLTPIFCTYNVCADRSKHYDPCQLLERDDEYNCHKYYNKLDCLTNINNFTTHFGTVSPDEALLANSFVKNVNVIAVISDGNSNYVEKKAESMLMVLVKDPVSSFERLRGKRMCHPGYGKLKLPRYYLNKFDETVMKSLTPNICSEKLETIIENRYYGLNQIFGDSCYPGPWVDYTAVDKELKAKYTKLCQLCSSTEMDKCSIEKISDPFKSALDCFKKNGDIVLTTYEEWRNSNDTLGNYYHLCPNGTTISKNSEPCYWGKRPKPLLVANSQNYNQIQENIVFQMFKDKFNPVGRKQLDSKINSKDYLETILFPDKNLQLLDTNMTLNSFLKDLDDIATPYKCDKPMKWCTTSEMEFEKCTWFKQATINQGITPTVTCVKATSQLYCIYLISKDEADITNILNNYGYVARKAGLKAIAYPETSKKDLTKSMVVVKNTDKFKTFNDLKNKYACFAEFGDIAFMAFMKHLQNIELIKKDCDHGLIVSEFVGDSCAPGANDDYHGKTGETDVGKLCNCVGKQSAKECGFNNDNEYYGNEGALKCLSEIGDFAVITNKDINLSNSSYENYTVICKNGSLAAHRGLNVDDNCFLVVTINTELVVKRDNPNIKDFTVALSAFEEQFGRQLDKAFQLFNIFNGTKDLLFKDSTPGLSFESNEFIRNYVNIFDEYDKCVENDDSGAYPLNNLGVLCLNVAVFLFLFKL